MVAVAMAMAMAMARGMQSTMSHCLALQCPDDARFPSSKYVYNHYNASGGIHDTLTTSDFFPEFV